MNVILKYTQTKEFDKPTQEKVSKIQFSRIPEMRVVNDSIPYQANVLNQEELDYLQSMLEYFGTVDIIGKWNDDGKKIECDMSKYRDTLNNIEVFEKVEVSGMIKDEEGNETEVVVRTFTGVKSSKRPTLTQAKKIQVNVFNNKFEREL